MKNYWLPLLILFVFNSCSRDSKVSNIDQFIPEDAEIVIKTSNIEGLISNLKNNDFLKKTKDLHINSSLEKKLTPLVLLNTSEEVLFSIIYDSNDSLEFTLATRYRDSLFNFFDKTDYVSETLKFDSKSFEKISWKGHTFYSMVRDSFLLASSNLEILKNLPSGKKRNTSVEEAFKTANSQASFSTYINHKKMTGQNTFLLDSVPMSNFSNYSMLDVVVSQDEILLNGITKSEDSLDSFINVFKDTKAQENKMSQITPSSADGFLSFTFDNYRPLISNLKRFRKEKNKSSIDTLVSNETLFEYIVEIGVIYEGSNQALVLNSLDEMATSESLLGSQNVITDFREIKFLEFDQPAFFKNNLFPLITSEGFDKYCVIDNYFIFSNSLETLQNIVSSYQNNSTYASKNSFLESNKQLSNVSSLLMVFDDTKFDDILSGETSLDLSNYKSTAIQFIYDHHFAHTNMVIGRSKVKAEANSISEEFNIKLDADILTNPQFVTNYTNNQKDIVVQDVNNNLYLISNKGEVLWKKKLEGSILGKIEQVDIFKNGRLQFAFATPNRVYIIDRNGKEVNPFPLKFNDVITQPLSVFDYDNKRDYRLLVTQGKNVLMYDLKGKIVKGFDFKSAASSIITQPEHFRMGSRDYIVIKTKEKIYILDRRGNTRVNPKTSATFSNEKVYVYESNFTTTSENGILFSIDERGNTSTQQLNLNEQHHIDATSKTLVTLTDNKLSIKSNSVELDFGLYSRPKIFYLNDKIYVSVTDTQTNKVYLFDSLGKSIPNFPVYGSSSIDMDNSDNDKNLEIIVKSGTNELLMYQIN